MLILLTHWLLEIKQIGILYQWATNQDFSNKKETLACLKLFEAEIQ